MNYDTKASVLGAAASGAVPRAMAQKHIEVHGHPFAWHETKPVALFVNLLEHIGATHIVDFTPGSGALAIASLSLGLQYEGLSASGEHNEWLDMILDRVTVYLCAKSPEQCVTMGAEESVCENVKLYFAGTIMEAKRLMEPTEFVNQQEDDEGESTDSDGSNP